MAAVLGGLVVVHGRIPAARELLDGAHVDDPVVQVLHQTGHVTVEELLVGAHGVAGQQRAHAIGGEAPHVFDDLGLGLGDVQAMLPLVDQPGVGVHPAHEVVHLVHGGLAGLDDIVDALVQHVQVEVGGDHGDLDQFVMEDVQAGHLAVDPDQAGILRRVGLVVMCVHHRVPRFLRTCTEQTTIYHL